MHSPPYTDSNEYYGHSPSLMGLGPMYAYMWVTSLHFSLYRGLLLLTLSIYARLPAVSYMQAYITLNPLAGGFIYTKEITINTFNFYTK